MPNPNFVFSDFFQDFYQIVFILKVEILEFQNFKFAKQFDFEIIECFKHDLDIFLGLPNFVEIIKNLDNVFGLLRC